MADSNRQSPADLTGSDELLAMLAEPAPWRFFSLVQLLTSLLPGEVRIGEDGPPHREPARFRGHASLSFPPRDVVSVTPGHHLDGAPRFDVEAAFFGLYGPASPLPLHDTVAILRDFENGPRVAAFLDIFNHRALSLLYRAWASARWWVDGRRWGDDGFTRLLSDLIGPVDDLLAVGLRRETLVAHAGIWLHHPRGPAGLLQLLRAALPGLPVTVDPVVVRAVNLPMEARAPLGKCRLGHDAMVGARQWTIGEGFRVRVGPLTDYQFARFRAGGADQRLVRSLVEAWCEAPTAWELELIVDEQAIPTARLSAARPTSRLRAGEALLGRPRRRTERVVIPMNSSGGSHGSL